MDSDLIKWLVGYDGKALAITTQKITFYVGLDSLLFLEIIVGYWSILAETHPLDGF